MYLHYFKLSVIKSSEYQSKNNPKKFCHDLYNINFLVSLAFVLLHSVLICLSIRLIVEAVCLT